jgi:arylsulfatase A-like enzyme
MGGWNGAVCIASRTMFNTGRFLWNAHEVDQKLDSLANAGQLWSQLMQANGYDTYMTGKWHVKINPEKIFTTVGTKRPGMPGDTPEGYNRPLSKDDWEWTPWDSAYGGFWEGGTHWSELVANETITFLDSASVSTKPFFMYIAFNAPHDPRQSPKKYVDMYPLEAISLPVNFMSEYPYKDKIGCGWSLRDERLAPMPRTEYSVKVNRQEYYAIITHMDHQIGRIIEHLEKTGQKENTYIFFTADHGLACGNHGLMGKQNMYEHSLKPPMIIVGPDIPKGEKRDVNVYLQDIMPTVLDYAGTEIPDYIEFSSLKEMIDDLKTESTYPGIYGAYKNHQRMIRMNRYKLIAYPFEGVLRLFDLEKDPMEMNDLATIPKYQNKVDSMYFALRKLQREMNDTLQLDNFTFSQLSH